MKSNRRHELQQNVLGAKITEAVSFLKRYGTRLAWGVLLAVLVVMIAVWAINKRRQKRQGLWAEFHALAATMDKTGDEWFERTKKLADQDTLPILAARACVALGDAYSALPPGRPLTASQWSSAAEAAEHHYNRALADFSDHHAEMGRARLGLARLALDRGDLDAARAHCDAVIDASQLAGHPVVAQAGDLRQKLEQIGGPVPMAAGGPTSRPAGQPPEIPAPPASVPATRPDGRPETAPAP